MAAVAVVMERIKNVQLKCWPFALSVPLIVKPTCCLFKAVFFLPLSPQLREQERRRAQHTEGVC